MSSKRIGAAGGSYGGGMSMALGALKDRKVLPDGRLVRWRSPDGKRMRIAATAPNIPWTDLAYSLAPNGSTLDYLADSPYRGRPGVEKMSFVTGLYLSGLLAPGFYAAKGSDPSADVTGWKDAIEAGEPYGADVDAALREMTTNHSSYYIDHSVEPAPMLMSSGFTDDLFPADETIRYYNRTGRSSGTRTSRSSSATSATCAARTRRTWWPPSTPASQAWLDYYVKGDRPAPAAGCRGLDRDLPEHGSVGRALSRAQLGPHLVGRDPLRRLDGEDDRADLDHRRGVQPGHEHAPARPCPTPTRPGPWSTGWRPRLPAATRCSARRRWSPTSRCRATPPRSPPVCSTSRPAAPRRSSPAGSGGPASGGPKRQVFQLHPNGWTFAAGHVPKLELLAADADGSALANYGRPSNDQQPVTVSKLELRIPVVETGRGRPAAWFATRRRRWSRTARS